MKVKKLIQALIKEEMDPRRPKDKAFDLAQQLSKLSPEDREKVAMIQQMISKEKMDKDDYGRSISGKDKSTFVDPEDLMPAARAKKLAGMEDDEMETRYDYDDPIFEAKFKEGDTVIPNIGPHKGVKHKIIYDFGNGKYNIQPIGLRPNQIQYRLGAASASEDQLKMADDVNEEIERPFFANQKYYDELNDLRDKGLLKSGISSLQSKFNLSREKAKEIFNKYLEDLKAEQPEAFDFFMKDLNEGDTYEKMAAKGKKAGNLKQGTVRKRLRIKDGEKIPLARINKAISSLKKRKSLSDKDKKYLKALNLAKTLKTTTNVKEIATELGYLNEAEYNTPQTVKVKDITFDMVRDIFKDEYKEEPSDRPKPDSDETVPSYKYYDSVSFTNGDGSSTYVTDEVILDDWKEKTLRNVGNVDVILDPTADVWFNKVRIEDPKFKEREKNIGKGIASYYASKKSGDFTGD